MRIKWHRLALFGIEFALPLLTLVVYKIHDQQRELFSRVKPEIAECPRCHKLFSVRAGLSFLMHLIDVHKLDFDEAESIVALLYKRYLARKAENVEAK